MENKFKSILTAFLFIVICPKVVLSQTIQMVFTSDAHYGITVQSSGAIQL